MVLTFSKRVTRITQFAVKKKHVTNVNNVINKESVIARHCHCIGDTRTGTRKMSLLLPCVSW